jgi:hypothetical protein
VPPPVIVSAPPAESGVTDADFGQTVMIPVGAMPLPTVTEAGAAAPTARRLEDVGEVIPVSAHDPFLANDTERCGSWSPAAFCCSPWRSRTVNRWARGRISSGSTSASASSGSMR